MVQHYTTPHARPDLSKVKLFPANLILFGVVGFFAGLLSSVLALYIFPEYVYPNLYHYDHLSWIAAAISPYLRYGGLYIPAISFGFIVGGVLCLRQETNVWNAFTFTVYGVIGNCAAVLGPALLIFAYERAFGKNPLYIVGTDVNRLLHNAAAGYILGFFSASTVVLLAILSLTMGTTHKRYGPLIVLGGLCGTLLMILAPQSEITKVQAGMMAAFFELWQMGIAGLIGYFIDRAKREEFVTPSAKSLL